MFQSKEKQDSLISHGAYQSVEQAVKETKKRIEKEGDFEDSSAKERLQILDELSQFNFGKYLIQHRGLNGQWTKHMVLHPQNGRLTGCSDDGKPMCERERWLLDRTPLVLATQERFFNFQRILQKHLREGIELASVPCGLMDDLLGLNFFGLKEFYLTGIDLDEDSINGAQENAKHNHLEKHCEFLREDAWNLGIKDKFDVLTSNGLNFYEPDDVRVAELYEEFHRALKPGGTFITSFVTPPPARGQNSPWDAKQINSEDLRIQKVIVAYILEARWLQAYRTEETTRDQLEKAGFKDIRFIYDRQHMFPTVTAVK